MQVYSWIFWGPPASGNHAFFRAPRPKFWPPPILRAEPAVSAHDPTMNFTKNIGMLLLAVYLIVVGIIGLTGMGAGILLPILALVAGIFILIGK
jgi:hypothetical protein